MRVCVADKIWIMGRRSAMVCWSIDILDLWQAEGTSDCVTWAREVEENKEPF